MTLGGLVLALLTAIAARQQRALADLADYAALGQQIQDAHAIVRSGLQGLAPLEGDIREARDTAIEFRSTIAAAIVCDTSAGAVILPPTSDTAPAFASITQSVEAGDSAWMLTPDDSSDVWTAARITYVAAASAGECAPLGPALDPSQVARPRVALTLSPSSRAAPGVPVLITRPVRYSLYRASDGFWYLGQRDWNNTGGYLNTVQPVAGPFLSAAQGGLRLTYFDTSGRTIASPVAGLRSIAAIRLDVRGQTRNARRILGAATDQSARTDSASANLWLRNR